MEAVSSPAFWWLKTNKTLLETPKICDPKDNLTCTSKQTEDPSTISSSLREFLEKERALKSPCDEDADTDIGSIIDEINKLAAASPLGPYETSEDRTIDEIMREAEKIYMESSKSFEQLSARSRTSANLSASFNDGKSTPTPKSASPLPLDSERESGKENQGDSYSDDFTEGNFSDTEENPKHSVIVPPLVLEKTMEETDQIEFNTKTSEQESKNEFSSNAVSDLIDFTEKINLNQNEHISNPNTEFRSPETEEFISNVNKNNSSYDEVISYSRKSGISDRSEIVSRRNELSATKNELVCSTNEVANNKQFEDENFGSNNRSRQAINKLEEENRNLLDNISVLKTELEQTSKFLEQTKTFKKSPDDEITVLLKKAYDELKDAKETKTALELQLDNLSRSHQQLKITYDDVVTSNKNLNQRLIETETLMGKYKTQLETLEHNCTKFQESENNLTKLLEIEKLQVKSYKGQNEKDAKCIQDLNRQVKEMERIIARKHPDSVSALIVAAKDDQTGNNLTARKLLEDRIKKLESEVTVRDQQSSKVFLEVQEKFSEMKNKYESHIDDLELHVNDLKDQLKRKIDTFDVYTQTIDEQKIPVKEAKNVSVQTLKLKKIEKSEGKEDSHLLATIRGFQTDLANKEKVVIKLQKELDEAKKTNKRLQKEREGSLKNIAERPHSRSEVSLSELEEELKAVKTERDKMKAQLCRIEEDYQNLKAKRLFDLTTLQQAHEHEITTYINNITPLREQLELHQATINSLKEQLQCTKEQMELLTRERNELFARLHSEQMTSSHSNNGNEEFDSNDDLRNLSPHEKIAVMEQRYRDRERRLRAIVHGLSQKNVPNNSCQQCDARQRQLIMYKNELDQLLATLRTLT